ncbi:MAG: Hsp20/alpha crystallin family protein [Actinobacteria bacterium]|nr:Hsp20/alpha crystallin family protein [Actinomycetota bacterium]MBU4403764.1 Hsp20/alpha crystallin family protein [Actinomycetota bacterium]MCG2819309.1 Hsp20/alpha crystallin family protein [Actinomycetes bacterium]
MVKEEEGPGKDLKDAIDLGKISFKGLTKNLGDLMSKVSRLVEEGGGEIERRGEIEGPGDVKGIYGFTIRTGLGGDKPVVREFGNIKPVRKGAIVEEVREPIVDVFDEEGEVAVVVEIPGVDEGDIDLELKDDVLIISTSGEKKYQQEVLLPRAFSEEAMESACRNGVLKVTFNKE